MNGEMKQDQETVQCGKCEKTLLKQAAIENQGKYYCCDECAEGKTCDCQ